MLKWIGRLEIAFDLPVTRSVSSSISLRTAAALGELVISVIIQGVTYIGAKHLIDTK